MRILVTGGAGFIGSHVVDRCLAEGHQVAIVDDLSTGRRENLNPRATFFEDDIRDADRMREIVAEGKPRVIVHHAAQMDVRRSVGDPVFDAESNVLGSLNLILAAVEHDVERFVYASTGGAIYGDTENRPTPEDHPPNPISPYGVSKHTVEHYLHLYRLSDGLGYMALRYGNVYGPRQNPHGEAGVVAIFAGLMLEGKQPTIFGDGTMTRDYVYVEDVVEACWRAVQSDRDAVLNIGTGVESSVLDIFNGLKQHTGHDGEPILAERRAGEMQNSCLDPSKAHEVLDWQAQVPLDEGLRRTVEYWRDRS